MGRFFLGYLGGLSIITRVLKSRKKRQKIVSECCDVRITWPAVLGFEDGRRS